MRGVLTSVRYCIYIYIYIYIPYIYIYIYIYTVYEELCLCKKLNKKVKLAVRPLLTVTLKRCALQISFEIATLASSKSTV